MGDLLDDIYVPQPHVLESIVSEEGEEAEQSDRQAGDGRQEATRAGSSDSRG